MITRIEHVNITVPNIDAAVSFLKIVAPDFDIRKDEKSIDGYRWLHIGNDEYYFALQEAHLDANPKKQHQTYKNYGVNHLALIVADVEKIENELIEAGYSKGIGTPKEQFRKRTYFYDNAGFEWELVEYLSEKPNEKFLYE